ncbi:MAG TPA: hypothetical protein DDZ41_07330, partial [Flavobacterium sp.]|nr:hypothetical protein [Flavobacterium sp.]
TQWVHVAAVFNNGELSLYQNGTLSAQNTSVGFNAIPIHNDGAAFGGTNGTNVFSNISTSYNGCADEIMIFSEALNAAQVKLLHDFGFIGSGSLKSTENHQNTQITENSKSLIIYPNPSKGNINLITQVKYAGAIKIEIIDVLGGIVYEKKIYNLEEGYQHIPLKDITIASGVYILKIINNKQIQNARLIIKN